MNYIKIYNNIIQNRLENRYNRYNGYTEKHHIIPRSLGGNDNEENIVHLSAREHFLCHWLLIKIHPTGDKHYKLVMAFMMMALSSQKQRRITSRAFESYRLSHSESISFFQKGEKNSQFGTIWISNTTTNESKKIKKDQIIPLGWEKGRKINKLKGKTFSKEHKEKISSSMKGKVLSDEHKRKLSIASTKHNLLKQSKKQ